MAVYTDVAEGELGAFLKHYPVGDLLSYKGIAEGTENSNFLLHTSSGSYILTLYEKRVEKADLPFFLGLMDLPKGIIHADLFPDNVFFLGEKLSGLIDFYFACDDLYAYDVATCLNAWCFEKDFSFNLTKGKALLAGYQSVRPLSDQEQTALPVLARGSALRFMLTRLYDWLTVPDGGLVMKRDPTEYIRRMRFHRAIKSPSEYGLA
ncbi:MAG: hypothetical protein E5Y74_14195 [Mesorhizobium sp.]|nr:MAG: hypothetical protein E5Y74_14195 [Mesorhizobium sp.]